MKNFTKMTQMVCLATVVVIGASRSVSANQVTIDMGTVTGGGFPSGDSSAKPYLVATITDLTGGGVSMTLTAPGLGFAGSGLYEHVLGWDFNVSSTTGVTATETAASGHSGFTIPGLSTGSFQAPSGPSGDKFNLQFAFSEGMGVTDGPNGGVEFGNGDSVTYKINGVTTSSFIVGTVGGNPDTYYSEAQVDDANPGTYVGGVAQQAPSPTPDGGSTVALLGGALLGLHAIGRKFRRSETVPSLA
jgi:VPDSG-CTERM motif